MALHILLGRNAGKSNKGGIQGRDMALLYLPGSKLFAPFCRNGFVRDSQADLRNSLS